MNDIKLYLLDMDGTIYIGDKLIAGAKEKIEEIRQKAKLCFVTNNSSKNPTQYIEKLSKMGIDISKDEIYTSGDATIEYLKENYAGKSVYLVGNKELAQQFEQSGIILSEQANIVVLGYDTELTYQKLLIATTKIAQGATYIATHPDFVCPCSPVYAPDVGSFIALLQKSANRLPDVICGKPDKIMGECIKRKFKLDNASIAFIGDRLYTDILFGNNNGFTSILVFSGETTKQDYLASSIRSSITLESIAELVV
ncbi:MAG: HAD-IIA family hydrolase [Clostridia bacterium]